MLPSLLVALAVVTMVGSPVRAQPPTAPAPAGGAAADAGATPVDDTSATGTSDTTPRGTLQGSAYLSRSRRVIGATVVARSETDTSARVAIDITATDARGAFRLDRLADGSYRVEVTRAGLAPVVKSAVELRHPFRAVVEVGMAPLAAMPVAARPPTLSERAEPTPRPTLRLSAEIQQAPGEPFPDAELRLRRADGGDDPRTLRSAAGGAIDGVEISAGSWQVEVTAPGFLAMRTLLDIEGDVHLRFHLVRQPTDYVPSPLELMPPELPLPPAGMEAVSAR